MKYIYFPCIACCWVFVSFFEWNQVFVSGWNFLSIIQKNLKVGRIPDHNVFAGKFLKTCIFAQIASVFCNLVFKAQFLKVICWLMVELSGHRFKQSFQKYRFFISLNTVPSFFKGVNVRLIWEKVEIWKSKEDLSITLTVTLR